MEDKKEVCTVRGLAAGSNRCLRRPRSNYFAATPPCVRCGYKYMETGKACLCCGASWKEQIGGF